MKWSTLRQMLSQLLFLPSPQERAYRREVGGRAPLTDDEFYARFYEGAGIPWHIPIRVRDSLAYLDLFIERAYPSDVIAYAYDDLDFSEVVFRVERAFDIRFSKEDHFTGTLGDLIEQVCNKLAER